MANQKMIKITLVKSPIGYNKTQAATAAALGLGKLNSFNIVPDNASIQGAVFKIKHLVKVEEVKGEKK